MLLYSPSLTPENSSPLGDKSARCSLPTLSQPLKHRLIRMITRPAGQSSASGVHYSSSPASSLFYSLLCKGLMFPPVINFWIPFHQSLHILKPPNSNWLLPHSLKPSWVSFSYKSIFTWLLCLRCLLVFPFCSICTKQLTLPSLLAPVPSPHLQDLASAPIILQKLFSRPPETSY